MSRTQRWISPCMRKLESMRIVQANNRINRLFVSAYHRVCAACTCTVAGVRSMITAAFAYHRVGIDDSAEAVGRWRSVLNRITYWLLFKWARKTVSVARCSSELAIVTEE